VEGYSINYLLLNIQGYLWYSIFNVVLFASPFIQDEYKKEHNSNTIPVSIPDIVFAIHGLALSLLLAVQCLIYPRGAQKFQIVTIILSIALWLFILSLGGYWIFSNSHVLLFLDSFGYAKMVITLSKYAPQVYLHYVNKGTKGWSIVAILLDLAGSLLSFFQMFIVAFDRNDWSQFTGNIPKLGLSIISLFFDIIFIFQHYVLYRDNSKYLNLQSEEVKEQID